MIVQTAQSAFTIIGMQARHPRIVVILDIKIFRNFIVTTAEQNLMAGRAPEQIFFDVPIPNCGLRRPQCEIEALGEPLV